MEVREIGNIVRGGNWDSPQRGRIYSVKGLCPCLNTVGGGGLEPKIITEVIDDKSISFVCHER